MKTLRLVLALTLSATLASAAEVRVPVRLTGLFQPDRKDDLLRVASVLKKAEGNSVNEVKLVDVDYESESATFVYDGDKVFKNQKPEQVIPQLDNLLREASNHTFSAQPPGGLPHEKWRELKITVAIVDCKACAYGLYLALNGQPGVQRVTTAVKSGLISAWVDPGKTSQKVLEDVLRQREVIVKTAKDTP